VATVREEIERRLGTPWSLVPANGRARTRWVAIGDPQTRFDKLLALLAHHAMIDERGWLRPEVGLLSIGDHFDFGPRGGSDVGREGELFLRWLADHPTDQTLILAGNHDLSRVQELAFETDESFAAARTLADSIRALDGAGNESAREELTARFSAEHPRIPTPDIAARDYGGFAASQRVLLQALLVHGRVSLGLAARHAGREVLFTHAAVTARELAILDLPTSSPKAGDVASALDRVLREAIAKVEGDWARGMPAALELGPLHVAGSRRREGGGLLYHRPSNPTRPGADRSWELDEHAPRRFHPRTLPVGLVQVCGHSGHPKCRKELDGWLTPRAASAEHAPLRTLRTDGVRVEYDLGLAAPRDDEATLYLIDGEIDRVAIEDYGVFPFERG
jgi:hypothetical protein